MKKTSRGSETKKFVSLVLVIALLLSTSISADAIQFVEKQLASGNELSELPENKILGEKLPADPFVDNFDRADKDSSDMTLDDKGKKETASNLPLGIDEMPRDDSVDESIGSEGQDKSETQTVDEEHVFDKDGSDINLEPEDENDKEENSDLEGEFAETEMEEGEPLFEPDIESLDGMCGESLMFSVTEIGTMVIEGTGEMYNFESPEDAPWYSVRNWIKKVKIMGGTTVGEYAFYDYPYLDRVEIYDFVETIGEYAFAKSPISVWLYLPHTLTEIKEGAFYQCSELFDIRTYDEGSPNVPGTNVQIIGDHAFEGCRSLSFISIGKATDIGFSAFANSGLKSIKIPSGVTELKARTFQNCELLTAVEFDENSSLMSIGAEAFQNCPGLGDIQLLQTVKNIGESAFDGCTRIEEIALPDSITELNNGVFANCGGLRVIVPNKNKILQLSADVFSNTNATVHVPLEQYMKYCTQYIHQGINSLGENVEIKCGTVPGMYRLKINNNSTMGEVEVHGEDMGESDGSSYMFFPGETITLSVMPKEGVLFDFWETDENLVLFEDPTKMTVEILMPEFDLNIETNYFEVERSGQCGDNIVWGLNQNRLYLAGAGAISDWSDSMLPPWYDYRMNIEQVFIDSEITYLGKYSFYRCSNLKEISISNSEDSGLPEVTTIPAYSFYGCTNFDIAALPDSITCIEEYAFYECSNLSLVVLPKALEAIERYAFYNDDNLKIRRLPDNVTQIGEYSFYDCDELCLVRLPDGVVEIPDYAFYNCSKITLNLYEFSFPKSLTSVGNYAFYNCTSIAAKKFPTSLQKIGDYAFYNCINMKPSELPGRLQELGSYSLANTGITGSIRFWGKVSVGDSAFKGCQSFDVLSNVTYEFAYLGEEAFMGCTSLTAIKIANIGELKARTFQGCTALESVTLNDNITIIGEDVFKGCKNLKVCSLPDTLEIIDPTAFSGCEGLTEIRIPKNVSYLGPKTFSDCVYLEKMWLMNEDRVVEIPSFYEDAFGYPTYVYVTSKQYKNYKNSPQWNASLHSDKAGYAGAPMSYYGSIMYTEGVGGGSASPRSAGIQWGQFTSISARPSIGCAFTGWTSDNAEIQDPKALRTLCTLKEELEKIPNDVTVTANFKKAEGNIAEVIPLEYKTGMVGDSIFDLQGNIVPECKAKMDDGSIANLSVIWDFSTFDCNLANVPQVIEGTIELPDGVTNSLNLKAKYIVPLLSRDIDMGIEVQVFPATEIHFGTGSKELKDRYLPQEITIRGEQKNHIVSVIWDTSNYDPTRIGHQIIPGEIQNPENDFFRDDYSTQIKVVILPPDRTIKSIEVVPPLSISAPQNIMVGQSMETGPLGVMDMVEIPSEVTVSLTNNEPKQMPVEWDVGSYDPAIVGTQEIWGTIILPDDHSIINPNNCQAKIEITTIAKEYEIWEALPLEVSIEVLPGTTVAQLNDILKKEQKDQINVRAVDKETDIEKITVCTIELFEEDAPEYDKDTPGEYMLIARLASNFVPLDEDIPGPIQVKVTVKEPLKIKSIPTLFVTSYQSVSSKNIGKIHKIPNQVSVVLENDLIIPVDVEWDWDTYDAAKDVAGNHTVLGTLVNIPSIARQPDGVEIKPTLQIRSIAVNYRVTGVLGGNSVEGDAGLTLEEITEIEKPTLNLEITSYTGGIDFTTEYEAEVALETEKNPDYNVECAGSYVLEGALKLPSNITGKSYEKVNLKTYMVSVTDVEPQSVCTTEGTNFFDIKGLPEWVPVTLSNGKQIMMDVDWGTGVGYTPYPDNLTDSEPVIMSVLGELTNYPQYVDSSDVQVKLQITMTKPLEIIDITPNRIPEEGALEVKLGSSLDDIYNALETHDILLTLQSSTGNVSSAKVTFTLRAEDNPAFDPKAEGVQNLTIYIPLDDKIRNPNNLTATLAVKLTKYTITSTVVVRVRDVLSGTPFEDVDMPVVAALKRNDGVEDRAPVTWDGSKYNPTKIGTQVVKGTFVTPLPIHLENPLDRQPNAAVTIIDPTIKVLSMEQIVMEKPKGQRGRNQVSANGIDGFTEYQFLTEIEHEDGTITTEIVSFFVETDND